MAIPYAILQITCLRNTKTFAACRYARPTLHQTVTCTTCAQSLQRSITWNAHLYSIGSSTRNRSGHAQTQSTVSQVDETTVYVVRLDATRMRAPSGLCRGGFRPRNGQLPDATQTRQMNGPCRVLLSIFHLGNCA